jgi:hypothetical protein
MSIIPRSPVGCQLGVQQKDSKQRSDLTPYHHVPHLNINVSTSRWSLYLITMLLYIGQRCSSLGLWTAKVTELQLPMCSTTATTEPRPHWRRHRSLRCSDQPQGHSPIAAVASSKPRLLSNLQPRSPTKPPTANQPSHTVRHHVCQIRRCCPTTSAKSLAYQAKASDISHITDWPVCIETPFPAYGPLRWSTRHKDRRWCTGLPMAAHRQEAANVPVANKLPFPT